ncbi:MAG: gluconolactonase [Phenylobacterium sp.]|nr:gluconolactonase [Phenylobacterium sp.]
MDDQRVQTLKALKLGSMLAALAVCGPLATAQAADAPAASANTETGVLRLDPALDKVIAPGARIEKVATGFGFAEGPMWRQGRLWFADLTGNKMLAVSPDGKVEVLIDHAGGLPRIPPNGSQFKGSNGMVTDKNGTVLMNQHGARRIVRLDNKLHITPFLERYNGKRLNSPNDLVFAPDGSLWITDPPYGLDGQDKDPAKEVPFNGVYRYANGKLTAVITDIPRPNGIGFSPDGKTLYVSNSEPKMFVRAYDVAPGGKVSNPRTFIEYPEPNPVDVPDGLKVDSAGNVWTSGPGGIRIISPKGKVLGQIKLPEKAAANLAWADGGHTVYICSAESIYRLKLATPGKMPLYQR